MSATRSKNDARKRGVFDGSLPFIQQCCRDPGAAIMSHRRGVAQEVGQNFKMSPRHYIGATRHSRETITLVASVLYGPPESRDRGGAFRTHVEASMPSDYGQPW